MPVSLTAALQFLPTHVGRRFCSRLQTSRWSGAAMVIRPAVASLAYGLQDARVPGLPKIPNAPSGAQAETARRGADARARRARASGRARSPRSPIAPGAAEQITPRWDARGSLHEG